MDAVADIKARLSIEELVGQYCQLTKRGRNFVALCPFHQDSHPSFLVSPDKGICYCFPCQKGGDIFSFYQLIEGVDFSQALKELAEKTGVELPDRPKEGVKSDEKDRMRACLKAAQQFYTEQLKQSESVQQYLSTRGTTAEEIALYGIGFAPDSYTATYDHLLKKEFSRNEIMNAGLAAQTELNGKMYDRFRNRLMFPIFDNQGRPIGFGGRTMGDDNAKYINSAETPLYRKSTVLYGLSKALPAIREAKRVVLVEGYFDVLACHRIGIGEAVATCGTALTEEHVRLLKRYADTVTLCMDQDSAGIAAADKAFSLCSKAGLRVEGVVLSEKDPADLVVSSPEILKKALTEDVRPYLSVVLASIQKEGVSTPSLRAAALQRLLPLLQSIASATERNFALREAASALATTEMALSDDLRRFEQGTLALAKVASAPAVPTQHTSTLYSAAELTLGLILLYPQMVHVAEELIEPEDPFANALYKALSAVKNEPSWKLEVLELSEDERKKASVLVLYCEESGFGDWSDSIALKEIRKNCIIANRDFLHKKKKELTQKLIQARIDGEKDQETDLSKQYQEVLLLSKKAM